MIMEEASVEVVEVVWRKLTEVLKLLLLYCFKDKLLVVRGEESHRSFSTCALERIGLADGVDEIKVCADIEPAHGLETLRVLKTHLKVDLGNLEPIIDEVDCLILFFRDRSSGRLDTEDGALLQAQIYHWFLLLTLLKASTTDFLFTRSQLVASGAEGLVSSSIARIHRIAGKILISAHIDTNLLVVGLAEHCHAGITISIVTAIIGQRLVSDHMRTLHQMRMVMNVLSRFG